MIAMMEKKNVTEKKDASEKYVFNAMKNIAINKNKPNRDISTKEKDVCNKKDTNYSRW